MAAESTERLRVSTAEKRRLLERAREFRRTPSRSEELLWQALRRNRLGFPIRRQQVIGPFIVDFFVASHDLVIEVDGPVHAHQEERDRERQELLEACGYRVLRVTADDVEHRLPSVLEQITLALACSPS